MSSDRETTLLPGGWSLRLDQQGEDFPWAIYDDQGVRIMGYCQLRASAERFAAAMNGTTALHHPADEKAAMAASQSERDLADPADAYDAGHHEGEAYGRKEAKAEIERLAELADKFKWQVIDTCRRAERAEAALAASRALVGLVDGELAELSRKASPDWCVYSEPEVGLPPSLFSGQVGREGFGPIEPLQGWDLRFAVASVNFVRQQLTLTSSTQPEAAEHSETDIADTIACVLYSNRPHTELNDGLVEIWSWSRACAWEQERGDQGGDLPLTGKARTLAAQIAAVLPADGQCVRNPYRLPKGWKLVPVEPTQEMLSDGEDAHDGQRYAGRLAAYVWAAMLATAPKATTQTEAAGQAESTPAFKGAEFRATMHPLSHVGVTPQPLAPQAGDASGERLGTFMAKLETYRRAKIDHRMALVGAKVVEACEADLIEYVRTLAGDASGGVDVALEEVERIKQLCCELLDGLSRGIHEDSTWEIGGERAYLVEADDFDELMNAVQGLAATPPRAQPQDAGQSDATVKSRDGGER